MEGPSAFDRRIAMLIDGDNAQPSLLNEMLAESAKYGTVTIRRIYGDWTTSGMKGWKDALHVHAVQPVQQFRYTTGKNSTDSALIIDAMDILHSGSVNGFCLVSSDSDYTRLATRVREKGLFVMGIGKRNTPRAFVNACEVFVYVENLGSRPAAASQRRAAEASPPPDSSSAELVPLLTQAIEMSTQEDGWASLGTVGNRLHQLDPGFDPRTYGYKQLSVLVRAYPKLVELMRQKGKSGPSSIYVRMRE